MRWRRGERSQNLEDRRAEGAGPRSGFPGGLRGGLPGGGVRRPGRLGLGGIVLLVGIAWALGIDPLSLLTGGAGGSQGGSRVGLPTGLEPGDVSAPGPLRTSAGEEQLVDFVSFVLDDAQTTWARLLDGYTDARLVLFRQAVESGCGYAPAAAGPFYCPRDAKVYVDLGFFEDLRSRFGAPGDFAQAYVLAHEIGHHVQNQLGIEQELRARQRARPDDANALSVRMELQADCLAGVWGPLHGAARAAGAGRSRGGAGGGGGRRRRPHPGDGDGRRAARVLHARLVAAARELVPPRLRVGRSARLRHLRQHRVTRCSTSIRATS